MTEPILTGSLAQVAGVPVHVSKMALKKEQYRFPQSKKKRIRRKWTKRGGNFHYVPAVFMMNDKLRGEYLLVHPDLKQLLDDDIKKRNEEHDRKWR